MRQLEDVFDGQAVEGDALPHYSPRARQQAFWVPQRGVPPTSTVIPGAGEHGSPNDQNVSRAISPFSGYTLADIPVLSIIPVPITTGELVDGNEFYTFAYARRVSRDLGELMQYQVGQGTSQSLGVILGRTNTGIEHSGSTSSTGSSNESGPVVAEPQPDTQQKKWRFRSFKIRRRWRA
jgi:hypothetical protein